MTTPAHVDPSVAIAKALGVDPSRREFSSLRTVLGGLHEVTTTEGAVTIPVPGHLVRSDIEFILQSLPGLKLSGTKSSVVVSRATSTEIVPSPLEQLTIPTRERAPSQQQAKPSPADEPVALPLTPPPHGVETRARLTNVLEALGVSGAEISDLERTLVILDKASKFSMRETKHARSDGFLMISVPEEKDAIGLLEALGFSKVNVLKNLWAGLRYERTCRSTDTKSTATIAHTTRECEITMVYGEPLTDSRDLARGFSAIGSTAQD